jgi:phosphoribosylformylglycinamidine cyclo-ligase
MGDHYLVASTDGVGTKLKVAFKVNQHRTVGFDLVAMCVNALITCGARPLFFLDYYATAKLDVDQAEEVIDGIIAGCEQADCALIGGETAEMPGMYQRGEYDICGFAVGNVAREKLIDGQKIEEGDVVIGIPSSGVHSNGFSLVRRIVREADLDWDARIPGLRRPLGEELLTPTRIYVRQIQQLINRFEVRGLAHITGGGLIENTMRALPKGRGLNIDWKAWERPAVFSWLQEAGQVPEEDMLRTFNMGIGMVLIVSPITAENLCEDPELIRIGVVT